jgi:hypothetical protein
MYGDIARDSSASNRVVIVFMFSCAVSIKGSSFAWNSDIILVSTCFMCAESNSFEGERRRFGGDCGAELKFEFKSGAEWESLFLC